MFRKVRRVRVDSFCEIELVETHFVHYKPNTFYYALVVHISVKICWQVTKKMENNQVFANKKAVSVAIQLNDCKAVVLSSTCLFPRWGRWHIPVKSRGFPLPPMEAETECCPEICPMIF